MEGKICTGTQEGQLREMTCEAAALMRRAEEVAAGRETATAAERQMLEEQRSRMEERLGTAKMTGIAAGRMCEDLSMDDLREGFRGRDFCRGAPEGKLCFLTADQHIKERPCRPRAMALESGMQCADKSLEDLIGQEFNPREFCHDMPSGSFCVETPESSLKQMTCEQARARLEAAAARRPSPRPERPERPAKKFKGVSGDVSCADVPRGELMEDFDAKIYCRDHTGHKVCMTGPTEESPLKGKSCAAAVALQTAIMTRMAKKAQAMQKKAEREERRAERAALRATRPVTFSFERTEDQTCPEAMLGALPDSTEDFTLISSANILDLCQDNPDALKFHCPVNKRMLMGDMSLNIEQRYGANVNKWLDKERRISFPSSMQRVACRKLLSQDI